jgi:tetratricopeptide (TPR) repeat protein
LTLLEGATAAECASLELDLWLALLTPAAIDLGWSAPLCGRALQRIAALIEEPCRQDDPRRLPALSALALAAGWSAQPERAYRLGEQLLALARPGDRQSTMLAHWVLGQSQSLRGRLAASREHLEQALAHYDPEEDRSLGSLIGGDLNISAHGVLAYTTWLLGYPDQARRLLQRAAHLAEALRDPACAAFVHVVAAMADAVLGRDLSAALRHAEALHALGQTGQLYGLWADLPEAPPTGRSAATSAASPGSEQTPEHGGIASAVPNWQASDVGVGYGARLLVRAQLLGQLGQPQVALACMDEALSWAERTGVRVMEAEMWRMRGELLAQLNASDEAPGGGPIGLAEGDLTRFRDPCGRDSEACFQRALLIARRQQSRWLELRAATSLARLWLAQNRATEVRDLLAPIYHRLNEGFDTADVAEAKALLAQLEASAAPDRRPARPAHKPRPPKPGRATTRRHRQASRPKPT